jgi:dual oxidase
MAVNIQRGREHGIPDFNTAREAYGLPRYTHAENFTRVNEVPK